MKKALVVSFFICLAIFLTHYFIVGTAVYGDGKYYYSITRSIVVDHDINYENEYEILGISEKFLPNGHLANKYPPGVSILWIVPFLVAHILTLIISFMIPLLNPNGYTFWYQFFIGSMSIFLSIFGTYLVYLTLRKFYPERISRFTSLTILFGTNLFFYSSYDVINSHAASFFTSSLILFLLHYKRTSKVKDWFIVGLAAGFAALIRTLDGLLIFMGIYFIFEQIKHVVGRLKAATAFFSGFILIYSIQLVNNFFLYGSLDSPYLTGDERFSFFNPHFPGVLFNSDTGLILWTPLVFVAVFGLLLEKKYLFTKFFFLFIVVQVYVISSWSSWDQGGSFGVRMMISSLPLISFGLSKIYSFIEAVFSQRGLYFTFSVTTVLNQILIIVYLITH